MPTPRTRIARLTTTCALTLTIAAASATPALATYNSWAGSTTPTTTSTEDDASTDGVGRPGGIRAIEDGAATDGQLAAI